MTIRTFRRTAAILFAAISVFAATVKADAQLAPGIDRNDGPWGVDVQTLYHGQALKTEGVEWSCIDLKWVATETGSQGNYDFTPYDKVVDYYSNLGFHQLYVLQLATLNPLYAGQSGDTGAICAAIARWAGAAAAHYRGRGLIYEIGNEPEVFPMGNYWSNPDTYTSMARATAKAIKAADPSAKVAVCAVAWMDRGFLTQCFNDGLLSDGTVDYVAFHGYHRVDIMPESGLARDVEWLRGQISQAAPGRDIQVIDTERSYALDPFGAPKGINDWKNEVYTLDEQAAYLARHYLTEIKLDIPITIWYKDMHGEDGRSLWIGDETGPRGMRPQGWVYRNLAELLPNSPASEENGIAQVTFNGKSNSSGIECLSYLRTLTTHKHQIVIAVWNPVEAFDGQILQSRVASGKTMVESWRPVQPSDPVSIPVYVRIKYPRDTTAQTFNLLAETPDQQTAPIGLHRDGALLVTDSVNVTPMPKIILVNVD